MHINNVTVSLVLIVSPLCKNSYVISFTGLIPRKKAIFAVTYQSLDLLRKAPTPMVYW